MSLSKWQEEFKIRSEDRLFSKKSFSLFFLEAFKKRGVLAGALFFIGVIVYVSYRPSGPELAEHELPLLKGPEKPFKIKHSSSQETAEPLKHKIIYEKLSAKKPDEKVEHLLKEPEEPMAPPPRLSEEFIGNLMEGEDPQESAMEKTSVTMGSEEKESAEEKPSSMTVSGAVVKKKKEAEKEEGNSEKQGTHWVQLASLKTREAAEREWGRLKRLSLLQGLTPTYGQVDMGEGKGIHHRLRIGPFSYTAAKKLCAQLKDQKVGCMIKKK